VGGWTAVHIHKISAVQHRYPFWESLRLILTCKCCFRKPKSKMTETFTHLAGCIIMLPNLRLDGTPTIAIRAEFIS
jgi:hypothetical protein